MARKNCLTRTLLPFLIASLTFFDSFSLTIAVFNDLVMCDAVYGSGLVLESCVRAFEQMPSGSEPAALYRANAGDPRPPGYDPDVESLTLPLVYTDPVNGPHRCTITVDVAPHRGGNRYWYLEPNWVQYWASMVIKPCLMGIGRSGELGLGGFVTYDLDSVIDVFFEPEFRLAPKSFMTITITEAHLPDLMPGTTDPRVVGGLALGVAQYYYDEFPHNYLVSGASIDEAEASMLAAIENMRAGDVAGNWQTMVYPLAEAIRIPKDGWHGITISR
ncbi:hypothetical protein MMC26_005614 [Xylographa opegraphella]|nr:hypothetical protein [Xylographa opegraphella]